MRRLLLLAVLITLMNTSYRGQSIKTEPNGGDINLAKLWLLSDLQALEAKSMKLAKPLARALATAEIADAAWNLDQDWAKKLLREAYDLTFPDEEEQIMLRSRPVGAPIVLPTGVEIAQSGVRHRVLEIARRDKNFVDQLLRTGAERLGRQKENYMYADLASKSFVAGDNEVAGNYILRAMEAEPTIINAGFVILDIAARDRAAADKLILKYIELLKAIPLSQANGSASRIYLLLRNLVFPGDDFITMKNIISN